MLAWVCILIAVNQLGFGNIVPVVPLFAKSFGVSQFLIGLTVAVYGLARFAANMPAGRVSDVLGRNWAIAIGGIITAGGNLICGLSGSYSMFLAGRFIGGLGAAMVLTGTQIISDRYLDTRESRQSHCPLHDGLHVCRRDRAITRRLDGPAFRS